MIGDLVAAADQHPQGVLLVIDELGKFLESASFGGDDIGFLQDLAEAASRASGKLVVVGILHQSFDAYAVRLGRQARDDWAKVQGRYVDIPLVAGTDEVLDLVGRAIEVQPAVIGLALKPLPRRLPRLFGSGGPVHQRILALQLRVVGPCIQWLPRYLGLSHGVVSVRTNAAPSGFWRHASRLGFQRVFER